MSFQAYLDNVKARTGKTPEDFRKLAAQKGLGTSGEIVQTSSADRLVIGIKLKGVKAAGRLEAAGR